MNNDANEVKIIVEGGVADVQHIPEGITVRIIDLDNDSEDARLDYRAYYDPDLGCIVEDRLDEERQPSVPSPEDYAIWDSGPLGSRTSLAQVEGGWIGEFSTDEEAISEARKRMNATHFWPDLWRLSDHGNWTLIEKEND